MAGLRSGRRDRKPRRQFKLVMRGYHESEVAAFLALLAENPDIPVPAFSTVMRGYDPEQVDLYIDEIKARNRRPLP